MTSELIQIGKHRLLCGDLTVDGTIEKLMNGDLADIVYSDPPWGPGNQKYWHTMNLRGSKPRSGWEPFLEYFCRAICNNRNSQAPVFVEMGLRWIDDLDYAMDRAGLGCPIRRWEIFYGPKSKPLKNTVTLYGANVANIQMPNPPHGESVTTAILETVIRPGMIVLDPCTGLGMTARNTHKLGGKFRGNELNQKRLQNTAHWLTKHELGRP